jgi:hypothetical protein
MANNQRVYLDHLIPRQSLRYSPPAVEESKQWLTSSHRSDSNIRFDDIRHKDAWFDRLVKPDFQRATCAWDPEACVTFLRSVLRRRIIPSIILWRSNETGLVYVLDGAHRLSVLRAWMIDDWGDKAEDFYVRNENYQEILDAAYATRRLVHEHIGLFEEFEIAHKEWNRIALTGGAPRQSMSLRQSDMAMFYLDITASSRTLHAQWEEGDYAVAEDSFLSINRQGVPLDDLESLLIEFRNGSMGRVIMSIANAGTSGHYWPMPLDENMQPDLRDKVSQFNDRCEKIHKSLFVPPFDSKITDVNVPCIVAPGHFRLHQHLIEFLPLLSEGYAVGSERIREVLGKDHKSTVHEIINNADNLISCVERKLEHLGTRSNTSISLSIVPLIYLYNKKGVFVRALLYGWAHWLLSGSDKEIQERKIALSSVRGDLEDTLIQYKDEFSDIQHRVGAGLKSLSTIANFLQNLIGSLIEKRNATADERKKAIADIFQPKSKSPIAKANSGRAFTKATKAEINVRELLGSCLRCEICGGILDLKQGVQYDHKDTFSTGGKSNSENGRPTHPFCNLFRERITNLRTGKEKLTLPILIEGDGPNRPFQQLNLFDSFPGD